MASEYDSLVRTGAIGSLKREILLEAADDLYYLAHIRKWFDETAGKAAAQQATSLAARVASELIAIGLCSLASWDKKRVHIEAAEQDPEQLFALIDRYKSTHTMPFDYFLVATERGKEWVARYMALVNEL